MTNDTLSQFWISINVPSESITIPAALSAVSLSCLNPGPKNGHAALKSLTFADSGAIRFLELSGISLAPTIPSISRNCLNVDSRMQFEMKIRRSRLLCGMSMRGSVSGSSVSISDDSVLGVASNPELKLYIETNDGLVNISDSSLYLNATFNVHGETEVRLQDLELWDHLWTTLSPQSFALLNQTLSNFTVIFFTNATLESPYIGGENASKPERQVTVLYNSFKDALTLLGTSVSGYIYRNSFEAVLGRFEYDDDFRTNRTIPHWSPNLVLSATCDTQLSILENEFHSGTFFLDYPGLRHMCVERNPYAHGRTNVTHNRFAGYLNPKFNIWADLKVPLPPAMSTTSSLGTATVRSMGKEQFVSTYGISAHFNWWGASTGPWMCCHNVVGGTWVTNFVDPSYWCVDNSCTSFSTSSLSTDCVLYGCIQRFSKSELIAFAIITALTFLALIIAIFIVAIPIHRGFAEKQLRNLVLDDLLLRLMHLWRIALMVSAATCLACIAVIGILLERNYRTPISPRQYRLKPPTMIVLFTIGSLAIIEFFFIAVVLIAAKFRLTKPKALNLTLSRFYGWTTFFLCATAVLSLGWVPDDMLETKNFQGGDDTDLTLTSPLSWYIYVPVLINVLCGVLVLIPTHMLNQLMYHYEYAKINTALEVALLKGLASSPTISRRALILRIGAIITSFLGFVVIGLSISGMVYPEKFYEIGLRFLTPKTVFRMRSGLTIIFTIICLLANLLTIWVTFSYNRVALLTTLLVALLASCLAGIYDVSFWLRMRRDANRLWCDLNLGFSVTFTLLSIIITFLIYNLRAQILREIPMRALSNLNQHLDLVWSASPDHVPAYIPISTTDNDSDADLDHSTHRFSSINTTLQDEDERGDIPRIGRRSLNHQ